MGWNFYLDESGQSKSSTPHAVFGGFGISADKEQAFLEETKALFKDCYGYAYEEGFDLKGKAIFEKDKLKHLVKFPSMPDAERRDLASELASNSPNGTSNIYKKKAAQALAGLKFVDGLFALLKKHECKLFCSLAKYGVDVPLRGEENIKTLERTHITSKDEGYTTKLLNELEINIYDSIFEFTARNNITQSNIYPDQSDLKADDLRKVFFHNSHRLYVKEKNRTFILTKIQWLTAAKGLRHNYNFEILKSNEYLQIQIADIIAYTINWGFDTTEGAKQNSVVNQHINEIYQKHSQTSLSFIQPNLIKTQFKPLERFTLMLHERVLKYITTKLKK